MFIVFEGIDGSGKTTIASMVANELKSQGYKIFLTEEPTRTWLGEAVRRGIKEEKNPFTQAFLFFADRAEHIREIKKRLEKGEIVICDRYIYSTYAYQGAQLSPSMGLEKALKWLETIYSPIRLDPDVVILLTTSPLRGIGRIKNRERRESFERREFLERVQKIYVYLAEKYGFEIVDSDTSIEAVFEKVKEILRKFDIIP